MQAVRAGFRLEQVASWAGMDDVQAQQLLSPPPATDPAQPKTIAARPRLCAAVEIVRDLWLDIRPDPAPILAVCDCFNPCDCQPHVLATWQSLQERARAHRIERDRRNVPTQAGFTALARLVFGTDLDMVAVADPTSER